MMWKFHFLILLSLQVVHGAVSPNNLILSSTAAIQNNGSRWSCTASVLNERWVLTAAHCVEPWKQNIGGAVRVGGMTAHGQIHSYVKRVIQHPAYLRATGLLHDIAVVEIDPPLKAPQPVQLYAGETLAIGQKLVLAGYGNCGSWPSYFVQRLTKKSRVVANCNCLRRKIASCRRKKLNRSTDFRSAIFSTNDRSCNGDSGGPIFARSSNSSFKQVGVHSGSCLCNAKCSCSMHTSVSWHLNWIIYSVKGRVNFSHTL